MYVNDIIYTIKYVFNILNFCLVAEAYQVALRIKEKLLRKQLVIRKFLGYGRGQQQENKMEENKIPFGTVDRPVGRAFNVHKIRG